MLLFLIAKLLYEQFRDNFLLGCVTWNYEGALVAPRVAMTRVTQVASLRGPNHTLYHVASFHFYRYGALDYGI
jgi:hypothetical protein